MKITQSKDAINERVVEQKALKKRKHVSTTNVVFLSVRRSPAISTVGRVQEAGVASASAQPQKPMHERSFARFLAQETAPFFSLDGRDVLRLAGIEELFRYALNCRNAAMEEHVLIDQLTAFRDCGRGDLWELARNLG